MTLKLENFHDSGVPLYVRVVLRSSELRCKGKCSLHGTRWGQRLNTMTVNLLLHCSQSTSSAQLPDSHHLLPGSPSIMGRGYNLILTSCGDALDWHRVVTERSSTIIIAVVDHVSSKNDDELLPKHTFGHYLTNKMGTLRLQRKKHVLKNHSEVW